MIGSGFISSIHMESLRTVADAEVLAVMSLSKANAEEFAGKHQIPNYFTDLDAMLAMAEIDMVVIGAPNDLHCEMVLKAAKAGKHVVVEKPLCMNLAEADEMIDACKKMNVKLMYAEELCFAPKYE